MAARKKIAYFTPLPPEQSGIADYNNVLLEKLNEYYDITLFTETKIKSVPKELKTGFEILEIDKFLKVNHEQFKHVIYHIGSNSIHAGTYLAAVNFPGIVFLHEYVLHHLVKFTTVGLGEDDAYRQELIRYYGQEGEELARLISTGRAASETLLFHYPFPQRIIERSRALITTTGYISAEVRKNFPSKSVYIVPDVDRESDLPEKEKAREEFGITDEFLIAQFGLVSPSKGIEDLLQLMCRIKSDKVKLLLAGKVHEDYPLEERIEELGIKDKVISTGYIAREQFEKWLAAVDLCISLRYPTGGESSGALMEMMAAGKAVIVSEYAQFLEFPEDAVIRLPVGRDKNEILLKFVGHFLDNREELDVIGEKAKKYTKLNHNSDGVSKIFLDIINKIEKDGYDKPILLNGDEEKMFTKLLKLSLKQRKI